jgi:hypothetical protein
MASLKFMFLDRFGEPPRAVIYVKGTEQRGCGAAKTPWIATAKNLAAFEHEIDRLVADLADIRLEAQLRFADHAAKRYRVTPRWRILFRIK